MSSGSSRCVAPGRSCSAARKAARIRAGTNGAPSMRSVDLVIGCIMSTTSISWNRPWAPLLIGFWPVSITIGMPPS